MASNSKPFGLKIHGYIGETVITKRKIRTAKRTTKNDKKPRISEDRDEGIIYPENLLQVEVNETDELISPSDFNEAPHTRNYNQNPPAEQKKSARLKTKPKKIFHDNELEFVDVKHDPDYDDQFDHKGVIEVSCDICKMRFKNKRILKRHLVVHEGDIKCPVCGIPFRSKMNMGKHVASSHKKENKCDVCPARFHTEKELEEHKAMNKHIKCKNEKDIECIEPTDWCDGNLQSMCKNDVNYDIQTAIVSKMHKGVPVKDICRLYNVTPDIVSEIWNERDKFILPKKLSRRTISYINKILEPPLLEWYNKEKAKNAFVTGRMIQNLAERIAKDKGLVHFYAGSKWLEGFKKRHEISLGTSRRDNSNIPSESIWKSKFFKDVWQKIRPEYPDHKIYMADEVGLFYNPSKSREKKFAGKKFIQGEMSDRLSLLVCSNISGTDKRKLFVCGTEDPLKNSYRNHNTLPVDYKRHSQCYFTTSMFEEYVRKWNKELQKTDEKAILILDRASIHSKLNLSHLKLEFLPWKAVNSLMAIKNGVYTKLRTEFRNLLLQFKLMNAVKGFDRHLTCIEALEMLDKAWGRTPPKVITKSFLDLGFEVQSIDNTEIVNSDEDNEKYCEYLKNYDVESYFVDLNMLDMYLTVEENLLVGKGTNPTVFGGNHKSKDDQSMASPESPDELPLNTERPESNEKELLVKKTGAISDLEIVRNYLQSKNTSYSMYCNFLDVEKEVMDNFVKLNM